MFYDFCLIFLVPFPYYVPQFLDYPHHLYPTEVSRILNGLTCIWGPVSRVQSATDQQPGTGQANTD